MEKKILNVRSLAQTVSVLFKMADVENTLENTSYFRINMRNRSVAFRKEGESIILDVYEKNSNLPFFSVVTSRKRKWNLKADFTPVEVINNNKGLDQITVQDRLDKINHDLDPYIRELTEKKHSIVSSLDGIRNEAAITENVEGILQHIQYSLDWYGNLIGELLCSRVFCKMFETIAQQHIAELANLVERYAGLKWQGCHVPSSIFPAFEEVDSLRQGLERLTQALSTSESVKPFAAGLSHSFTKLRLALSSLENALRKNADMTECA